MNKHIILLSAVAAMAAVMTACTADEQLSQNTADGMISYSVTTANQTRAANSYCSNVMPESFNVWADFTKEGSASKSIYILMVMK